MNKNFGLAELVAPLPVDDFKADFNQFHPLYLPRNQPDYFSDLFSIQDFYRYFQRNDFRYPGLSLYRDGKAVDKSEYTYTSLVSGHPVDMIDTRSLFDNFDSGATILMGGLELSIDSMRSFCRRVVGEIKSNASITGFYTPSSSQGFFPHFDDVDVFVLQLHGTKSWRVYENPFPYATHTADCDVSGVPVLLEVELNPGDTLYIPRGFVHDARATDQASFHISLSLAPYTWLDVFAFLSQQSRDLPGFRAPFPMDCSDADFSYKIQSLFLKLDVGVDQIQNHFQSKLDRHLQLLDNSYIQTTIQ
jgi:ribosomal protein L16 Arg81 hydroxylase